MMNLALWLKKNKLSRRPGADLPAVTDGAGDGDVSLGRQPAAPVRRGGSEKVETIKG
jgi:hypothetical protein